MALISCPECSHHVSESAPTCPSCGFPIATAVTDKKIALRICPDCQGTGRGEKTCPMCTSGNEKCPKCRGFGNWLGDPCPDCAGKGYYQCQSCSGKGHYRCACPTCNESGQVSLGGYQDFVSAKRAAEEERRRENQEKLIEKQRKEAEATSHHLATLSERLSEVRGDLLQLGLSQGGLILTDSVYAVERAKIMMTHSDQLHSLRKLRLLCQYCAEPLEWKERLRKLQVHEKQECKEGWERVSKQLAENKVRFEEFLREHAESGEVED